MKVDVDSVEDFDEKEKLSYESSLLGIYVSGHPLGRYQGVIEQLTSMNLNEIQEVSGSDKRDMIVAGMVVTNKTILTKKGDKMSFAMLEDLHGKIECIVFPRVFAEFEELLKSDDPVVMTGQVNLAEEPRKFFPQKIQKLKAEAESRVTGVRVSMRMDDVNERKLNRLKEIILSYKGSVPCHFIFESELAKARLPLGNGYYVNPVPQFAAKINEIFNQNSVKFIVDGELTSRLPDQ
jgi:DNA polymerase-3 subunit alpha